MFTPEKSDEQARQPLLRIGVVPYLNVQPLVWAFAQPEFRVAGGSDLVIEPAAPRQLSESLYAGRYDVAIVPVFEYYRHPGYTIVPHGAIATRGRVGSVLLFSEVPIERVRTAYLDPSSLTSVNLLKVVLAERGQSTRFEDGASLAAGAPLPPDSAKLLIGDPALREMGRHACTYDLGTMWHELTGLPFVFAGWLAHPSSAGKELNRLFQQALDIGMENLDRIAVEDGPRFGSTPEFARSYFRENLCFRLDEEHLEGWRTFGSLCHKHGLCDEARPLVFHGQ